MGLSLYVGEYWIIPAGNLTVCHDNGHDLIGKSSSFIINVANGSITRGNVSSSFQVPCLFIEHWTVVTCENHFQPPDFKAHTNAII